MTERNKTRKYEHNTNKNDTRLQHCRLVVLSTRKKSLQVPAVFESHCAYKTNARRINIRACLPKRKDKREKTTKPVHVLGDNCATPS